MILLNRKNDVVLRSTLPLADQKRAFCWYNPLLARAIAEECEGVPMEYIKTALELDASHSISQIVAVAKALYRLNGLKG
jgi:hypothetical protein